MSTDTVAILGFVALFALMLLRVPVGMAMGLVGISGFSYLVGGAPALKLVGQTSMRTVTDYTFGVIPMFLLMGAFVTSSGMSRELFRTANNFVGHLRGGLGIATVAACGGFAAICGSYLREHRPETAVREVEGETTDVAANTPPSRSPDGGPRRRRRPSGRRRR